MLKRALIVIAAVVLAGCAATPVTYARLDVSPAQLRLDSTACIQEARTNAAVPDDRNAVPYGPYFPEASRYALGRAERAAQVQAYMYDRCMKSRGYDRTV